VIHAGEAVIPLRDENPTRSRPVVTVALILVNALVYLWQASVMVVSTRSRS
jgi:membrane associated rhomboid family serine protease